MSQVVAYFVGIVVLTACAPAATTPAASPEPTPSAAAAPVVDQAPASVAPDAGPAASEPRKEEPVAESQPAGPTIRETCLAMCGKLKPRCADNAFQSCRVNCTKYDPPPSGCDDVVQVALSCARDATDLVCANVAPESCAKKFREISACAAGQKPGTADADTKASKLPPGFALFESTLEGVKAPMPEQVESKTNDGALIVSAKHPDGAVYSLRKVPRPAGRLNEKIFLKVAMNLLGRCSDKMKMQGMVDKPGRTSIHYNSKCPDGSEELGLFWATESALFLARVKGAPGKLGPAEAFLYGFEAK